MQDKKYPKSNIYNKLVRDKIPEIIEKNGSVAITKIVSKKETVELLKKKLIEEGQELLETSSKSELEKEMSDVLEILHSLAEELGISLNQIEDTRSQRAEKRGRFKKRIFLIKTK